jgi:hypothetical protein
VSLSPDTAVRDALTGTNSLVSGTNLFAGPIRDLPGTIPDKAVFCLATGGPAPEAFVSAATGNEERYHAVQVRVRGNPRDFASAVTLARGVRDTLHRTVPSGYLECAVRETEPNYLGQDEQGRDDFSINVELYSVS